MKKIIVSSLLIIGIMANQSIVMASQPSKKKNVTYYKEKSQRSGSSLILAIAKKTVKDALKGAAIGTVAGGMCGIPPITAFAIPRLAYAYYSFNPSNWKDIPSENMYHLGRFVGTLPGRTAEEQWKWDFESKKMDVYGSCITGSFLGGAAGALYSLYSQHRAFSPAWAKQVEALKEENYAENPVIIGQESYLVSSSFSDISAAQGGSHYEIYLMPLTDDLTYVFNAIVDALKSSRSAIAFIAMRLNPRVSYYKGKALPRIIIGLKNGVTIDDTNAVLSTIYQTVSGYTGSGIHPRYSSEITPLIYGAFGSGDYKEIRAHQDEFVHKGSWLWRAADDMAYPSRQHALSLER